MIIILFAIILYPINKIAIKSIEITEVKDISLKGFNLAGNLHIDNPSIFTIPVESTDYQFVLKQTGDVLFSGNLPPFELEASSTATVPFTMDVQLRSTVNLALLMVTQKEVNASIIGVAKLNILGFSYDYPFETEFDLKDLLP